MKMVPSFFANLNAVNFRVLYHLVSDSDLTSLRPRTSRFWNARNPELQHLLASYYWPQFKVLTVLQDIHARYPRLGHVLAKVNCDRQQRVESSDGVL